MHRLKVHALLRKTPMSTNPIESLFPWSGTARGISNGHEVERCSNRGGETCCCIASSSLSA